MPDNPPNPPRRKTTAQLIADEEKKSEQLRARIDELKARQRVEERKKETRRKIIVGAGVIAHIRINPVFRKQVREALNLAVTDPKQKAEIRDLLEERAFISAMKEAARLAKVKAKEIADAEAAASKDDSGADGKGKTPPQ